MKISRKLCDRQFFGHNVGFQQNGTMFIDIRNKRMSSKT